MVDSTRRHGKRTLDDAPDFLALAGSADFTLQAAVAGGQGILAGHGGFARAPLPRPGAGEMDGWREGFRKVVVLEKGL